MKKAKGTHILTWYGSHADKKGSCEMASYGAALKAADFWEKITPGGSAVITRVLYNTFSNSEKWHYDASKWVKKIKPHKAG